MLHLQSQMQRHLTLACGKIEELQEVVSVVKTKFVWKIPDLQQCIQKAKDGEKTILKGDPFYTTPHGYKLKIYTYPDGTSGGKGTHLSLFVQIMKGEYDAILPWPFGKKITITIVDQQENVADRKNICTRLLLSDSKATQKPKSEYNVGKGFHRFASHEILKTRKYTLDDTLFLQVDVTDK